MTTPNAGQQPESHQNAAYPQQPAPAASASAPPAAPIHSGAAPHPPHQAPQQYQPRPAASAATTLGETNTFAVLAIVLAFLAPIAGIVFGHMGLSQIKRNGDAGRGIALTGLIISYAYVVFVALFVLAYVSFIFVAIAAMGEVMSESMYY